MYYTCIQQAYTQDEQELPLCPQVLEDFFPSDGIALDRKSCKIENYANVSPSSDEKVDKGPQDLVQGCQDLGFHNQLSFGWKKKGLLQGPPRASAPVKRA